jgi:hypothetical protein
MNHRLIHDATHALTVTLLGIISPPGSDRAELYATLYEIARDAIEEYETKRARMEARLRGAKGCDQEQGNPSGEGKC